MFLILAVFQGLKSNQTYLHTTKVIFSLTIQNFNDFKLYFLRDLCAIWYHGGELFHCNSAKLAAFLCPIMSPATKEGKTGDSLWQKARVNLDKLVEKNISL